MTKPPPDAASLAAALKAKAPRPQLCGDIPMRIARDGTWYYHGSPIGRKPLVKLFAGVLSRDESGDYWLTTPAERARIEVDDAPFLAVELSRHGEGPGQRLTFRTNVDDMVTAGKDNPIRVDHNPETGEPSPYVRVRGALDALLTRGVYYELVALGMEEPRGNAHLYGVWSDGCFFPLGDLTDET